jgi:hypothetical protein
MKSFLRQPINEGFSLQQSWSLLEQTMATPLPVKPSPAPRKVQ